MPRQHSQDRSYSSLDPDHLQPVSRPSPACLQTVSRPFLDRLQTIFRPDNDHFQIISRPLPVLLRIGSRPYPDRRRISRLVPYTSVTFLSDRQALQLGNQVFHPRAFPSVRNMRIGHRGYHRLFLPIPFPLFILFSMFPLCIRYVAT